MSDDSTFDHSFPVTRWSLIRQASGKEETFRADALEELCRIYWPPVFAFIRSRGYSQAEAEDLTQGFFAGFLSRDDFSKADAKKGKLRTFLLTSVTNYLSKEFRNKTRQKRGGGAPVISLDMLREEGAAWALEPADDVTPERVFEQQWAMTVLGHVFDSLAKRFEEKNQSSLFQSLRFVITPGVEAEPYATIAEREGTTEAAVRIAAHRLRMSYRELLRRTISETLGDDGDVEAEIRILMGVFA